MKFKIEIECDNSAFDDNVAHEIARILAEHSARICHDSHLMIAGMKQPIRDFNGTTVGHWELVEE